MIKDTPTLFERLNAPFPYSEYQYDSFGDRCYISGQSVTERLNEVLGVGFWKYQGQHGTEKIIQDANGKNPRIKMYVEFSLYNPELKEWITFIDVGSEQVKPGMNEGDATKSAITDGMKKCASRIGVASDLYKGLITWDKQTQRIVVPDSYYDYYLEKGWIDTLPASSETKMTKPSPATNVKKTALTNKLKQRNTSAQMTLKQLWQELAHSLDGFDEWVQKKQAEKMTEQHMLQILQKRLTEKQRATSA